MTTRDNLRKPTPRRNVRGFRLSRRAFLAGASATGARIWLPALDIMFDGNGTAHADGTPIAKRFVEFFWGVSYSTVNGDRTWAPRQGSGPLPDVLPYYFNTDDRYQAKLKALIAAGTYGLRSEHLTPSLSDPEVRRYIRIIDGVTTRHVVAEANQHAQAMLGVVLALKNSGVFAGGGPTGPSLDRYIASFSRFRQGTKPHVALAVVPVLNYGGGDIAAPTHRMSVDWVGMEEGRIPDNANFIREVPQFDPRSAFEEMFGSEAGAGDPERRASILDGVLKASAGTLSRLGARDRHKVEAHLESIRQIEKNVTGNGGCEPITKPETSRVKSFDGRFLYSQNNSNQTAQRVAKDMRDMAALMLKCDYTRTMLFMVTAALSGFDGEFIVDFSSAGGIRQVKSLHRDSHDAKSYHRLMTPWHMGQLAAFIKELASIPEGAGSALDNTLIWATSEHGPQVHSLNDIATIVAGGPKLVGGNHYMNPGTRTIADMHMGILQALDLPTAGYEAWVTPRSPNPITFV